MAYKNGESNLATLIQGLTSFNANNVTRGDWTVLNQGYGDNYAILRPGPFRTEKHTLAQYLSHWVTIVEVWQFFRTDQSDEANLEDLEDLINELITGLIPYRKLNSAGTAILQNVMAGEDVQEVRNQDGGLEWIMQDLRVEWTEEGAITYAE